MTITFTPRNAFFFGLQIEGHSKHADRGQSKSISPFQEDMALLRRKGGASPYYASHQAFVFLAEYQIWDGIQ
jgi:hypothetical protein